MALPPLGPASREVSQPSGLWHQGVEAFPAVDQKAEAELRSSGVFQGDTISRQRRPTSPDLATCHSTNPPRSISQ